MNFYPAIDLINKECVRLEKGDFQKKTVFNKNPLKQAQLFEKEGCKWAHIVDLDAAKNGVSENEVILKKIKDDTNLRIQFGGGVRDLDKVDEILNLGIDRVIIGTAGVQNKNFLESSVRKYKKKIWLGVDILNNQVRINGWTKTSETKIDELLGFASKLDLGGIILTDINKDGMMEGPNLKLTREMGETYKIPIIISGGVSNITDIEKIKGLETFGIVGAICGRAIYNNEIDINKAIRILGEKNA